MRSSSILACVVLTAAAGLQPGVAVAAAPDVACGDTLTVDTVLTSDLVCPAGDGLTVQAGVTLDLGGHALTGPGPGAGTAVAVDPATDGPITVRNGTIEDWGQGLSADPSLSATVEGVRFAHVGGAVSTFLGELTIDRSSFVDTGVAVGLAEGSARITGSRFVDNERAVDVSSSGTSTVTIDSTTFLDNETAVVCEESGVVVTDSSFRRNGVAVDVSWCGVNVTRTDFTDNDQGVLTSPGASLQGGGGATLVDSTFTDNGTAVLLGTNGTVRGSTFTRNAVALRSLAESEFAPITVTVERSRFTRNGDAVYLESPARVGRNTVLRNTGYGIYAPLAVDLGGNVASRNGIEPQCTGVVCRRS